MREVVCKPGGLRSEAGNVVFVSVFFRYANLKWSQ